MCDDIKKDFCHIVYSAKIFFKKIQFLFSLVNIISFLKGYNPITAENPTKFKSPRVNNRWFIHDCHLTFMKQQQEAEGAGCFSCRREQCDT